MSSRPDATLPRTRRVRKSVGGASPRKGTSQENATVDIATLAANRKKSRSKSMGPGGFDALKTGNGNRRASLAVSSGPPPRSILKPTMPIVATVPPPKGKKKDFTIDLSQAPGTKVALRTEEEQQAASKERERLEKEISDRRDARRKSLANRRVSFAAEATLHTFHEIEYMQDSAASTGSTRRQSRAQPQPDPRSTLPDNAKGGDSQSPGRQRDPHSQRRRRSSIASVGDNTLASTVYSSDSDHGDEVINEQIVEDDGSDSSDADDGTMMSVDDVTGTSVVSGRTISSESSDNIDEALHLARETARSNAGIDEEEEEIIPGLMGWGKPTGQAKGAPTTSESMTATSQPSEETTNIIDDEPMEVTMDMDMEMTRPLGGIIQTGSNSAVMDSNDDMSMDVTHAIGGILSQVNNQTRQLNMSIPSGDDTVMEDDEPMDFTVCIGGIAGTKNKPGMDVEEGDEDMSMEFTTAIGAVLESKKILSGSKDKSRRQTTTTLPPEDEDEDGDVPMDMTVEAPMEMTVGLGRILPAVSPDTGLDEATMPMEMTTVVGGILSRQIPATPDKDAASIGQKLVENDPSDGDNFLLNSSPFKESPSPKKQQPLPTNNQSPGLSAFRPKGLRRSIQSSRKSMTPQSKIHTPTAKAITPTTPKEATTPTRATASPKMAPNRSMSPERDTWSTMGTPRSPAKSPTKSPNLFHKDPATGVSTPRIVITPRRLSGIGVDRLGLGSPKVSQLLDRRISISDSATAFSPVQLKKRMVAFSVEDPRALESEIDKERQEDEDREDSRKIMEREADLNAGERDATLNLKEMIQSLSPSPKYQRLRGRKSLAVGSGKALLGKRPLDVEDSDDEQKDGVKRLKGHQGSPVRNVKLQQPPSKAETTGRITRSSTRKTLDFTAGGVTTPSICVSPVKQFKVTTPNGQVRFKDMKDDSTPIGVHFDEYKPALDESAIQSPQNDSDERIHLQDFLNMTSIRFMELNTTKRRATAAPDSFVNKCLGEEEDISLERCVVAGACTVPMLELYQHSCRELKKYISEGRKIVREIESETFEVNPPLFREYISASPDFKVLMDNQFKNVKTHARLQSKAMWYEWRMKLQDGLKEGLLQTVVGMDADEKILSRQKSLLDSVLPLLLEQSQALSKENKSRQEYADELEDCDPAELEEARNELADLDSDIDAKKKLLAKLRADLEETENSIGNLKSEKENCLTEIQEAERVREQCKGWSTNDIRMLKARVEAIEKKHGWAITGVSGTIVTMTYKRDIELVLDIESFKSPTKLSAATKSPIEVRYVGSSRERNPQAMTVEKEFFIDLIREHAKTYLAIPTTGEIKELLSSVASAWDVAVTVSRDIKLLNTTFPTKVWKTGDRSVVVKSSMLVSGVQTKVEVMFSLKGNSVDGQVEVGVHAEAKVVYGEKFNEPTMGEFLKTRIGDDKGDSWCDVLVELQQRLAARGRKG